MPPQDMALAQDYFELEASDNQKKSHLRTSPTD